MGSFSVWHWLIVLAIIAAYFVPLFLAVRTERSDRKASRARYALVVVIAVIVPAIVNTLMSDTQTEAALYAAWLLVYVALQVWFLRTLVQRLRDSGMGKTLAYWAIVPLVGFVVSLGMLFPPSKAALSAST